MRRLKHKLPPGSLRTPPAQSRWLVCQAQKADDVEELTDWEAFFESDDMGIPEELASMKDTLQAEAANLQAGEATQPEPAARAESTQSSKTNIRCYGCGVRIQAGNPKALGFVDPEELATKQHHRQWKQLFCTRCAYCVNERVGTIC